MIHKWLVRTPPPLRPRRSIIAFPPGEGGLATRDCTLTQHMSLAMLHTVQPALPWRAPHLRDAGLSFHVLHSLLEDSYEGAGRDLPRLHTALVGVALDAKGEGRVLEPCAVAEGAGRVGQSSEQKEEVWLKWLYRECTLSVLPRFYGT